MFVAQTFDAGSELEPYFSPDRPRLVDPELRHRTVGYLRLAPQAAAGYRTDGVWVWPEMLAQQASTGVGPQVELLDHLELRGFLLPDQVPVDLIMLAARVAGGPPNAGAEPANRDLPDPAPTG
jgi:hypothetical protein